MTAIGVSGFKFKINRDTMESTCGRLRAASLSTLFYSRREGGTASGGGRERAREPTVPSWPDPDHERANDPGAIGAPS